MPNKTNPKPGGEGLPYKKASDVIGGPADGDPKMGLNPEKGVRGATSVTPPKSK